MNWIEKMIDTGGDWVMRNPVKATALLLILVFFAANTGDHKPTTKLPKYETIISSDSCPTLVEPTIQYVVDGKLTTITTLEYTQILINENEKLREENEKLMITQNNHTSDYNALVNNYNARLDRYRLQSDDNLNKCNIKKDEIINRNNLDRDVMIHKFQLQLEETRKICQGAS